jgi:hypothetical protein
MANILLFSEVNIGEDRRAGTKGTGIALMHQKGFNTPPGFIITPDAFYQFISSTGRLPEIEKALGDSNASTAAEFSSDLQRTVMRAAFPEKLKEDICDAYECISVDSGRSDASSLLSEGDASVAVRSSHLLEEDGSLKLPNATMLSIEGKDALIVAIKSCYASLLSVSALSALRKNGRQLPGMAVVVQRMIDVKRCGTSESLNPATGDRGEIIIQVSDATDADDAMGDMHHEEYVVDKQTLSIKEIIPPARRILGDEDIMQIASLTTKIEDAVDRDCKIDWALSGKTVNVLQYRQLKIASPRSERILKPTAGTEIADAVPENLESDDSQEAADDIAALQEIELNQSLEGEKDNGAPLKEFDISMREISDMDQETIPPPAAGSNEKPAQPNAPDDLLSKVYHDAGNLLVTCDTSINARLRSYFQDNFQSVPPGFEETVLKISLRRPIPYLDDIILIHKLKERFLNELREPTVEEIFLALEITDKFIKEF